MSNNLDDFLAHYGVRGMKWGVRKGVVNPRLQRTKKENTIRTQRKDARRKRQTLSDKDLDSLIKRLEAEKKVKTLLDDDLSPGKSLTQQIIRSSGTKVAGVVIAGAGVWAVKTALEGGFRKESLVNEIGNVDKSALWDLAKGAAGAIPKLKK